SKTGTFNLGGQTKYGVAVRCSSLVVKVIQATASELPNPKLECSSSTPTTVSFTVNVSVDASLLASGDSVCVNGTGCLSASGNVPIGLNLKPGTQDLLVTLENSGSVKVAKVLKNVNVISGGSTNASLTSSDQLAPVSLTLPTPPTGYTGSSGALVFYLSSSNTGGGGVNASPTSYRPVSGFGGGDRYAALVQANATNASLLSRQIFSSSSGSPNLSFPAPWSSGSLTVNQTAHPNISGLSRNDSGLQGYRLYLQLTAQLYYTATLSKSWLGNTTSYALPDLSGPLGYTAPASGGGSFKVSAIVGSKNLFALDPNNPSAFQAGDYLKEATAQTNSYTVGGGSITLP
ncbi:MAG: peptidase S8 and S53 subtilisin kexin sedolisin, partial [Meiothermus silvanus]|nr:peptidase S8 and S53 subtilisin kexin sedolisin [Allomeiothermus silvanus]